MPKKARELIPVEVKRLVEPGFYAVGGIAGLHLQVSKTSARSWILRAKIGDLLAKRAKLMQDWARFIDSKPVAGDVTPIRQKLVEPKT